MYGADSVLRNTGIFADTSENIISNLIITLALLLTDDPLFNSNCEISRCPKKEAWSKGVSPSYQCNLGPGLCMSYTCMSVNSPHLGSQSSPDQSRSETEPSAGRCLCKPDGAPFEPARKRETEITCNVHEATSYFPVNAAAVDE